MQRRSTNARICLAIADDTDRALLAEFLDQTGYLVDALGDPELTPVSADWSLIIADEAMARRHASTLLHMRQQILPLYLPVLLTLDRHAQAAPWLRAGVDDVLRQPIGKDDLLARLEAFLRLRSHSEAMRDANARRFSATFDLGPVGIVHMAPDCRVLLVNPRCCEMLGYAESELTATAWDRLLDAAGAAEMAATIAALIAGPDGAVHRQDQRYRRKDGAVLWATIALSAVKDGDGQLLYLIAALEDITRRKEMEGTLEESARFIKSTIDALSQHICVIDTDGMILAVNKAWSDFAARNGVDTDTVWHDTNYLAICQRAIGLRADDAAAFTAGMDAVVRREQDEFIMEYRCNSQAEPRWFRAKVTRFPGAGAARLVIAQEDITEAKRTALELQILAQYDHLTNLPNRILLQDRLKQAIAHAARYQHRVWVLFLDLDRFKLVNDMMGHTAGDDLLFVFSRRLMSVIRGTDTAARFGGDEFILVLSENGEDSLDTLLKRIVAVIGQPLAIRGHEFNVTSSIGIAVYPNDGIEADVLIDHADIAMYRAKELGRNNTQFYAAAMNAAAQERVRLEADLRNALERKEFVLHYQPQVDLRTGQIVGLEALIRWQHPEWGMVMPGRFIWLAEETELIVLIGTWVMRTACRQAKAWEDAGLGQVRMAVNLSARQFVQQDLVQSIAAILAETGMAPERLEIELTETMVMTEIEHSITILHGLKSLGVQLSIDDFGTGYSSLSYLQRFPIDVLKIDQSFVRDILVDPSSAAIANAIVSMAHSLGISVIAEGVESEQQCDYLSRNMCDEIQGYWFSRPIAADAIEALLRSAPCLPARLLRMQAPARTLLIVDDEPNIVSALRRLLREQGYRILTAQSGKEGLELLANNNVDVILTDQRMPGMTGVEFLRTAKCSHPDTVRIVLSGYTEFNSITDAVNEGSIFRFLTKPWDDTQLRNNIAEAFQYKESADENRRLNLKVLTANQQLAESNRKLGEALARQGQSKA